MKPWIEVKRLLLKSVSFHLRVACLFVASIIPTIAQAEFQWAKRVASTINTDGELSIGMALDNQGNSYLTGWFDGTNNFGGILLTNNNGGGQDIFVAKYNPAGTVQWARRAGGNSNDRDGGRGIGVDNAGNIYVTGEFVGNADFGSLNLSGSSEKEFFLTKYDNTGVVQWVRQSTGGHGVYGTGLAVDSEGNSYAIGYANNGITVTFGTTNLFNSSTHGYSTFLVKYDNSGTMKWAQLLVSPERVYSTKIATDTAGNIYVRGSFNEQITVGNSNLTSLGAKDMFIVKFDSSGTLTWIRQSTGAEVDEGGVAVDQTGNVYVTGSLASGTVNFGNGITLTNAGSYDAFVAKYNSSGAIQWARRAGGAGLDIYWDVALDQLGNVYTAGALSADAITPNGSGGAMVSKYDKDGTFQWANSVTSLMAEPIPSVAAKCVVDSTGNCYLAGWYQPATTFGTNILQPQGYWNYFLTKLTSTLLPITIQTDNVSFGIKTNRFGFNILGNSGQVIVVEACTNLANNIWSPLQTNTLTTDSTYFSDPQWTNYSGRFYRVRSQ